jgi:hypothetical protein
LRLLPGDAVLLGKAGCWFGNGHFDQLSAGVRARVQQRVKPTPLLRHFGPEKALVVKPVLPRKVVALRWRGRPKGWAVHRFRHLSD